MNAKVFLLSLPALVVALSANAATCRQELGESTPTARFDVDAQNVVDHETKLTWARCALGQRWNGSSCDGEPALMSWDEAREAIAAANRDKPQGQADWRFASLPELATIVERRCFEPRVNEAVFPGAPSVRFWSGMEKRGAKGMAYSLDFGAGAAQASDKETKVAVRLVRGTPWFQPKPMPAPTASAAGANAAN